MKITMKKMIPLLLLAFVGLFTLSCEKDREDTTVYSTVYDLNRSFKYDAATGKGTINEAFAKTLGNGDYVLMFIKADVTKDGSPIWAPMPRTEYPTVEGKQEEVDLDFDYSVHDFSAYVSGTYDIRKTPEFLNNVTLRIIFVPGVKGASAKQQQGDLSKLSYDQIIKKFNINDSKVINL
ncbi:hypothetical protein [Chryseobacterium sp. T1]